MPFSRNCDYKPAQMRLRYVSVLCGSFFEYFAVLASCPSSIHFPALISTSTIRSAALPSHSFGQLPCL